MSVFAGPNIVNNSLQINLDWSNPRCYPGTGNTFSNLVNTSRNNGYLKNNVVFSLDNLGYIQTNGSNGAGGTNAVGDRIDINTSQGGRDRFNGTTNFSVFFWNYMISTSGRIWSTGSSGEGTENNDQCIWQMYIQPSDFFWWNTTGSAVNALGCSFNNTRISETWQYVGVTYSHNESGNNVARTWVDGVQVGISQISTGLHSWRDQSNETRLQWTLGGGYGASCNTQNTQHRFGPFHLYNRALTPQEIQQNFQALRGRFGI
jgi:hypothetical protein